LIKVEVGFIIKVLKVKINKEKDMTQQQYINLIKGRINQCEIDKRNTTHDTTKLFLQGQIQGLKQSLEIIEGKL